MTDTEDNAPRPEVPIPHGHPAGCPCLTLAFFQCAVAQLEQTVALLQQEVQRQQEAAKEAAPCTRTNSASPTTCP